MVGAEEDIRRNADRPRVLTLIGLIAFEEVGSVSERVGQAFEKLARLLIR